MLDPLVLGLCSIVFVVLLLGLIVARHEAITTTRPTPRPPGGQEWEPQTGGHYTLFVLGSGGHTAEMLAMIERSVRPERHMVRRYLVSAGDRMSRAKALDVERRLAARFAALPDPRRAGDVMDPGTFDIVEVRRARLVHQSWWTTPFTALLSLWAVFSTLLLTPAPSSSSAEDDQHQQRLLPAVVVTNGPGTGLVVLLVAHLLKMVGLADPRHQLRTLYIESFAKVRKLSLTGRLCLWLDLADLFIVQHEPLARQYTSVVLQRFFPVTPAMPHVPLIPEDKVPEKIY